MAAKKIPVTQKITPFLWFDANAEAAVTYYRSVFKKSKVTGISRYGDSGPGKPGTVMTISFQLFGQEFTAINGGPHLKFSGAISFVVHCQTQKEVDYYWEKLLDGGKAQRCGWLTDQFGVTWQIVPDALIKFMLDKNPARKARVVGAMMQMVKLDIAGLEQAYRAK